MNRNDKKPVYNVSSTVNDTPTSASLIDNLDSRGLLLRGLVAGAGVEINVRDFDNRNINGTDDTSEKVIEIVSLAGAANSPIDNLTSTSVTSPLSANQGRILNQNLMRLGDVKVVLTNIDRDALTGLTIGDVIHVIDDGTGKWIRYQITASVGGTWATSTSVIIQTEDNLNNVSAPEYLVVDAASLNNINIASLVNGVIVDTVTCSVGARVLLKNQVNQSENGVYEITGGAPLYLSDQPTIVFVNDGSVNYQKVFYNAGNTWYTQYIDDEYSTIDCASPFDIDISSVGAGTTIDGHILGLGNLILVRNQTNPSENGVYTVNVSNLTKIDVQPKLVFIKNGFEYGGTTAFFDKITGINWLSQNNEFFIVNASSTQERPLSFYVAGVIVDDYNLNNDQVILIKDQQLNLSENGVYTITPSGVVKLPNQPKIVFDRNRSIVWYNTSFGVWSSIDISRGVTYAFTENIVDVTTTLVAGYEFETQTAFYTLSAGDLVLVTGQNILSENGVYIIGTFSSNKILSQPSVIPVEEGTYINTIFVKSGKYTYATQTSVSDVFVDGGSITNNEASPVHNLMFSYDSDGTAALYRKEKTIEIVSGIRTSGVAYVTFTSPHNLRKGMWIYFVSGSVKTRVQILSIITGDELSFFLGGPDGPISGSIETIPTVHVEGEKTFFVVNKIISDISGTFSVSDLVSGFNPEGPYILSNNELLLLYNMPVPTDNGVYRTSNDGVTPPTKIKFQPKIVYSTIDDIVFINKSADMWQSIINDIPVINYSSFTATENKHYIIENVTAAP